MYPAADLEGAERRLRDFLIYRFGGPKRYVSDRGHPRLRARHFRFAITQAARDRRMLLMNDALGNARLPIEAQEILRAFVDEMSTFMINQDGRESNNTVPTGGPLRDKSKRQGRCSASHMTRRVSFFYQVAEPGLENSPSQTQRQVRKQRVFHLTTGTHSGPPLH